MFYLDDLTLVAQGFESETSSLKRNIEVERVDRNC